MDEICTETVAKTLCTWTIPRCRRHPYGRTQRFLSERVLPEVHQPVLIYRSPLFDTFQGLDCSGIIRPDKGGYCLTDNFYVTIE
jgi:hypothetical protein